MLERWVAESIAFMGGWLGVAPQAAMAIVYTVTYVMFFWPMSFSYAIAAMIGA